MVEGKCIESATKVMRRWKYQVANFLKQKSRIEKQSSIAGKKKDVFAPIAKKLIDVGCGNVSTLTCSGSADSDGAKQLANLTMKILDKEINATCNPDNFPEANMTCVDECTTAVEGFEKEAKKCYDLSKEDTAEEGCFCWTSEDMMMYSENVKSCKIAEMQKV